MAQNVTIAGASYSSVPAIDVPKTGGGSARFVDTSDANASASNIDSGKTAYVNGTKVTGTSTKITPSGSYGTVTPSTSAQNNINVTNYATINVGAIPNQKSDSGNVTLDASTTSKSYAAGYYANAHGAAVNVYDGSVS